ncbi:MAG: KEOPS complex subunit Cgi121 [Candidatus Micrarchaeota archaeon]
MRNQKIGSSFATWAVGTANNKNSDKVLKKLSSAKTRQNTRYCLFNAESAVSEKQAEHALKNALLGFENQSMILNDLGLEILLRLSGQRQIKNALDFFGAGQDTAYVGIVVISKTKKEATETFSKIKKELGFREINSDDFFSRNWKNNSEKIKKRFAISKLEIESFGKMPEQKAVESLAMERTALLDLET